MAKLRVSVADAVVRGQQRGTYYVVPSAVDCGLLPSPQTHDQLCDIIIQGQSYASLTIRASNESGPKMELTVATRAPAAIAAGAALTWCDMVIVSRCSSPEHPHQPVWRCDKPGLFFCGMETRHGLMQSSRKSNSHITTNMPTHNNITTNTVHGDKQTATDPAKKMFLVRGPVTVRALFAPPLGPRRGGGGTG